MEVFRYGLMPVLVTTDIAARGIDVPQIRAVINYDLPAAITEYIYRRV